MRELESPSRLRKEEQGVEEVGHPLYCSLYLQEQLLALSLRKIFTAHELRVCIHRGKIMPEIVRDGAGHSTDVRIGLVNVREIETSIPAPAIKAASTSNSTQRLTLLSS